MHTHTSPMRWMAGTAVALLLAGCTVLPQPPQPMTRYDLGLLPTVARPAPTPAQLPAVALAPLQAPLLGDGSTAMRYRLAYDDAQVLRTYSRARWSAPPAALVQQQLGEYLGQGGRVVMHADVGEALPMVQGQQLPVLRWSLDEFTQVFSTPQDSQAWIRLRVSLVEPQPQGDVLLAQQVFALQLPVAAPNAAAGAHALAQGVQQLGQQLGQWLNSALPPMAAR